MTPSIRRGADEPPLWTPAALAEWLAVPRATLYAWHHRGTGPRAIRVGRHLRYAHAEVLAWLARQQDADPAA